jgi:hypothetical protein
MTTPMPTAILRSVIVLICLLTFLPELQAQRLRNYHGFRQTYPGAIAIGLQTGANFNLGAGGPNAACNCDFDGGSGIGYHAGIHLAVMVNPLFGIRLQGLYEDYSGIYEADFPANVYGDDGAAASVTARRRAEVGLQYFGTSFMLTWFTGPSGLYLLSGAGAGFFVDGTVRDEEFLLTPGYVYPSTGNSMLLHSDGALDNTDEPVMRAALILGVGYDLPLGRGMAVAPEIQFDYPLTSVVDGNADWSVTTIRASVVLRFGL